MNRPRKNTRGKWRSGPPPSAGWWPASFMRNKDQIRWWDGTRWSIPARPSYTADQARMASYISATFQNDIEWTERPPDWPERSRT